MSTMNIIETGLSSRHAVSGQTQTVRPLPGSDANTTASSVAFTGTEGTLTVAAGTYNVRLAPNANCRVLVGGAVLATTGGRLLADSAEWFEVSPLDVIHFIAE